MGHLGESRMETNQIPQISKVQNFADVYLAHLLKIRSTLLR